MKNKLLCAGLALLLALSLVLAPSAASGAAESGGEAALPEALAPSALDLAYGGAYRAVLEGLLRGDAKIPLEEFGLDVSALSTLFSTLYYSEAEIFFVSASYSYTKTTDGRVVSLTPSYLCEQSEIPALRAEFAEMTDAILQDVPQGITPLLRVAYVHDYIAASFVYDTSLTNYDVYTMLKTGTGVCQPYALLARYLLRRLGIETECVTSDALSHEWNAVKLGDSWYHMDVTWDDSDDTGFFGQVGHAYFLASDADFASGKHAAPDWSSPAPCTDTRYDGRFSEVTSRFVFGGGEVYAIEDGSISRFDPSDESLTALLEIDEIWHSYLGPIGWQGTFSGLSFARGVLLYNTEREICYYDPTSGESGTVATLRTEGGYLYGSLLDGHELVYALKREPNDEAYSPLRTRLLFTVTWVIGQNAFAEEYFYGERPTCKEETALPEDSHSFVFIGWDKEISAVSADATYTALYASTELYPESGERFVSLVALAASAEATLSERFSALSEASRIASLVNPAYAGVSEAAALLPELISEYNADAAAFYFAGWVPRS